MSIMEEEQQLNIDVETYMNVVQIELKKLQDENIGLKVANVQLQKNISALREQLDSMSKNTSQPLEKSK